jgi:hypothetical protein
MKAKLFFSILVLASVVPGALARGNEGETDVHTESGQLHVTPVEQEASTNVPTGPGAVANDPKEALQDYDDTLMAITEKFSRTLAAIVDAIKRGELTTDQGRELSAQQYQLVQMQFELVSLWRAMHTYGIGSTVDLPQFSAMVMGLDDWPAARMEEILEDRLLRVVRSVLGSQVRQLKAAPLQDESALSPFFRTAAVDGVPVAAFPRWLVCTQCRLLAPIRSGLYSFRYDSNRPERSCFIHKNCPRLAKATAIPARFLVACDNGHIDDFPWNEYLHGGGIECPGPLELRDVGASGEAADVMLSCRNCQKRKPLAPAFSDEGKAALPKCRGWHPHLRVAPLEECQSLAAPITLGATNVWFARTLSALSIPSSSDPLEQLVEQDLLSLFEDVESERDAKLARKGQPKYDPYTDAQIWAAIQRVREEQTTDSLTPKELKDPEWKLFSTPDPAKNCYNAGYAGIPGRHLQYFTDW